MSYCACDCDGHVDLRNMTTQRARKEHRCHECGKVIEPGTLYRTLKGKFEGDFFRVKQCPFCAFVADDLMSYGYCIPLGDLWDMVEAIENGN